MTARRVVAGCGIAAVVALLVGGCGLAAVVAQLPAGEHPDVDFEAAEISSARAAKAAELERELDAVDARYGAGMVGPRWRVDRCEAGQDNFTREDRYAYSCRMRVVELLPVRAPARAELSRLGEALLSGACPGGTNVDRELAEHSGRPEQLLWVSGDCTPGQLAGGGEIVKVLSAQPSAEDASLLEMYLGRCGPSPIAREHCVASDRRPLGRCVRTVRDGVARSSLRLGRLLPDPVAVRLARVVVQGELPRGRGRALAFPYPESFERQLGDRVTKRLKSLAGRPAPDSLGGSRFRERRHRATGGTTG